MGDWDFSWQKSYSCKEAMFLEPGEEIELTCTYDNSAEHQPTLNGERVTQRDVRWGEQTLDEINPNWPRRKSELEDELDEVDRQKKMLESEADDARVPMQWRD